MISNLTKRWLKYTNKALLERYGMTEFGMGLSQPYEEKSRVPSSVGTPMSSVRHCFIELELKNLRKNS